MDSPHHSLLSREFSEQLAFQLDCAAAKLESCINYGTYIFSYLIKKGFDKYYETIPTLLYRHILEMTDATQVLLHQGVTEPSDVLIRSAYEAFLGLEFVLKKDTELRCKSYVVADTVSELKILQSDDFRASLSPDSRFSLKQEIEAKLRSPLYKIVYKEYKRTKKANNHRPPTWYSLFDGPKNLAKLSKELDRDDWYTTLYTSFSQATHATNILRKIWPDPTADHCEIRKLRSIQKLNTNLALTIGFIVESSTLIINNYLPEHIQAYELWYVEEIMEFQESLINTL